MLDKTLQEMEAEEQSMADTRDFGYITACLFLDPKHQAKYEGYKEFPGYLRFLIDVRPDEIPSLETDDAKRLYEKLLKEAHPEKDAPKKEEYPAVIIPEYENMSDEEFEAAFQAARANKEDIVVEPEELKEAPPEEEEPILEPEPQPEPQPTPQPQSEEPLPHPAVQAEWTPSSVVSPFMTASVPPQQPRQAFQTPLDISDKAMLQFIRNIAWKCGLETFFFQEPTNDLIKICYTTNDGSPGYFLDDWLDFNETYFPDPTIIPNKAVPILYQPIINIDESVLTNYMSWKRSPMLCPAINDYITTFQPDRLITDMNYNSHPVVKQLDTTNSRLLQNSLIQTLNFLDTTHPELTSVRWEFAKYTSPESFELRPVPITSATRGLVFYTAAQTSNVIVTYDRSNAKEPIKVEYQTIDAAQSAQNAADALKRNIGKANPANGKKPAAKKTSTRKNSKKQSEEEAADAEAIQGSKK